MHSVSYDLCVLCTCRYVAVLGRARALEQRVGELDEEDPLAAPENLPGPRPKAPTQRRAELVGGGEQVQDNRDGV